MPAGKKRAAFLMLMASSSYHQDEYRATRKTRRKYWVKEWLQNPEESGAYVQILQELKLQDAEHFRKYLPMNTDVYEVNNINRCIFSLSGEECKLGPQRFA